MQVTIDTFNFGLKAFLLKFFILMKFLYKYGEILKRNIFLYFQRFCFTICIFFLKSFLIVRA